MAKERRDTKKRILRKGEYQKADGRYMYKYKDIEGVSRYVYSWRLTESDRTPTGKSHRQALREIEKDIIADINDNINTYMSKKLSLNHLFKEFIKQKHNLKCSTRTNYIGLYKKHVKYSIGKVSIKDIKYMDIKKFYNSLIMNKGLKISTIRVLNSIIHALFKEAIRNEYIKTNPTDGVIAELTEPARRDKKQHALTMQQQERFIEYVKHSRYKKYSALFTFLLGTGCRINEALALTWKDCDFKNNLISINHSLTYIKDKDDDKYTFHITLPKTQAGIRFIPMFLAVKKALLDIKRKQTEYVDENSSYVIDGHTGFVFISNRGGLYTRESIYYILQKIIENYNIYEIAKSQKEKRVPVLLPHFSAHNLRHTFCTRMCENESDIKLIQTVMGHSNIQVTMNIYNESTIDNIQKSFKKLDGKFKIG